MNPTPDYTRMVSYFAAPINNTKPLKNITIRELYDLIRSDFFKKWTDLVRAGEASKSKVLPYVTWSAVCTRRHLSSLLHYTRYICIDLDKVNIALKVRLASDVILNPVMIFVSPSGNGLKLIVSVPEASRKNHLDWFNILSLYLQITYGVEADRSGSDICRACFLCMDEKPYFNEEGCVDSKTLLAVLPRTDARPCVSTTRTAQSRTVARPNRDAPPCVSTTGERPSDILNRMPEIHAMAVRALERIGWQQNENENLWTRPNKDKRKGCSAIYNLHPTEGIWFLTCFTSNDLYFKAHRGYTDVQILCLLDYNDNWTACIIDLASRFLEPAY